MKVIADLFGEIEIELKKQSFEAEYSEYINSAAWRRIRDAKIKAVGGICEGCGISKWSARLEVHHLTYDRFKHERLSDLKVLCQKCHEPADEKRKEEVKDKRENSPLVKGFQNWMDRGNSCDVWRDWSNRKLEAEWEHFLDAVSNRTGREYKIPFWRHPKWY